MPDPNETDDDEPEPGDELDDENEDDLDPEDRSREPVVHHGNGSPVAQAVEIPAARVLSSAQYERREFLELTDQRVKHLDVRVFVENGRGRRVVQHVARIKRPWPFAPELFSEYLQSTYGRGVYSVVQRDGRKYLGSRTYRMTDGIRDPFTAPTASEGTDAPPGAAPRAPVNGSARPIYQAPAIQDWKIALVTSLTALATTALTVFAKSQAAPPAQRDELDRLVKLAELMKVPSDERAKLFREGMDLMREMGRGSDGGSGVDWSGLVQGALEFVKQSRAQAPATPATAPRLPAGETSGPVTMPKPTPNLAPADFMEAVILTEIQRATSTADGPETLVTILEAWLPEVCTWIEVSADSEILQEIPNRYPKHADYLKTEPVQNYLRSVIALIREDAAEAAKEDRVPQPAGAGAD